MTVRRWGSKFSEYDLHTAKKYAVKCQKFLTQGNGFYTILTTFEAQKQVFALIFEGQPDDNFYKAPNFLQPS